MCTHTDTYFYILNTSLVFALYLKLGNTIKTRISFMRILVEYKNI